MIWEHALSGWSIFTSGHCCAAPQHVVENCASTAVVAIGPAPYFVGLACKEYHQLMKESFIKIGSQHSRGCTLPGVYWGDMETSIFYLDAHPRPVDTISSFDAELLSNLQHVALVWATEDIRPIIRTCQALASRAPALRTIIVQIHGKLGPSAEHDVSSCSQSLAWTRAAYYSTILDYPETEYEFQGLDCVYLRGCLREHFTRPGPRVHILPPATTNCSP